MKYDGKVIEESTREYPAILLQIANSKLKPKSTKHDISKFVFT